MWIKSNKLRLTDFIVEILKCSLNDSEKYMGSGCNGPYNDKQTLVRNYGYWLINFSKCFELTGDQIYLDKVYELSHFLFSKKSRPYGYSFHHRLHENKDKCNGLIGQAWTFEALTYASIVTKDPKYVELAENVFFQHVFNYDCGLWNRLEIDGTVLSIDSTFNHQLWFTACSSMLKTPRQKEISERISCFMDQLNNNLTVLDNGLIYHPIENQILPNQSEQTSESFLMSVARIFLSSFGLINSKINKNTLKHRERMIYKSIGYHQFNMYAFAILKQSFPDHFFWDSLKFHRTVDYLISDEFKIGLNDNIYGYPYNPPGFEIPFVLNVFSNLSEYDLVDICSWWVNEQIKRCYEPKTRMMIRNTEDPLTHTARIYELTRLPNSILEKIEVSI